VLQPGMNRFDCRYEVVKRDTLKVQLKEKNGAIRFKNADMEVVINTSTGLVDRYRVGGADYLKKNAFLPLVIKDDADPWGANVDEFREVEGKFELMTGEAAKKFSAVEADLPSVRVVEDGPVRSIVEAILSYGDSFICQRYKLPKQGTEFEVETRVYWNEKHRMLKLSIPSTGRDHDFIGQVAYGKDHLLTNGKESVAQKWVAMVSKAEGHALTCVNDGTYGCSFEKGELRVSMLRSVAYSALPVGQPVLVLQDRYTPCAEQGERLFHFWVNAGATAERMDAIDHEAIVHNEKPYFLAFYPSGEGEKPKAAVTVDDPVVQVAAVKKSEVGNDLVIRLFEPTGTKRSVKVSVPALGMTFKAALGAFEIKTYRVNPKTKKVVETDLIERKL
jgi:alpha-mannosidase